MLGFSYRLAATVLWTGISNRIAIVNIRGEQDTGIPGVPWVPGGIPWEWEWKWEWQSGSGRKCE